MRSIDIKMISYSHANKTHFHKKGSELRPRPNVELFMRGANGLVRKFVKSESTSGSVIKVRLNGSSNTFYPSPLDG